MGVEEKLSMLRSQLDGVPKEKMAAHRPSHPRDKDKKRQRQ